MSLGLAIKGWVNLDSCPRLSEPQFSWLQLGRAPWDWTVHSDVTKGEKHLCDDCHRAGAP